MKKLTIQNLILDNMDVENKIQRIGLQILEDNINESKIIFFGISDNGKLIAEKLIAHITKISKLEIDLVKVNLDNESVCTTRNLILKMNQYLLLVMFHILEKLYN